MPTTIHASVSPGILKKVDRLFTNRLDSVFVELLQNARRAGATRVEVTAKPTKNSRTLITFTDNGGGIEDFGKLLDLGSSDWGEEMTEREDPAGMGFFSLVQSGVTVRSNGKRARITKAAFLGRENVVVEDDPGGPARGTELAFTREENVDSVKWSLDLTAKYGPIRVFFNGAEIEREPFLAGAVHVKDTGAVRIGVFRDSRFNATRDLSLNFYGNVIRVSSRGMVLEHVLMPGPGGADSLRVTLDVIDTSVLRLKLPDRDAIVEDAAYEELRRQARIALFEALAKEEAHQASFALYKEAAALGVDIHEADLLLDSYHILANDSLFEVSTFDAFDSDDEGKLFRPGTAVLVDLEASVGNPCAFAFEDALQYHTLPHGWTAVGARKEFEGYKAYDRLPRLTDFRLYVNGQSIEGFSKSLSEMLTMADSLTLTFSVVEPGKEPVPDSWDIQFAGFFEEVHTDEPTMIITKNSPWAEPDQRSAPFDLVAAACHLAFSFDEDGDSYDTQHEEFESRMESEIQSVLGGKRALAEMELRRALGWDLTRALDKAGVREVRLFKADDGNWGFELPAA